MMTAEPGLDVTGDPVALVAADAAAIDAAVTHLRAVGGALERTATGLRGIEVGQWSGEAADAFRARFDESPARWFAGADAFADAARAWGRYAVAVQQARDQAGRAAELYRRGVVASETAVRERHAEVEEHDARVTAANAGQGPPPSPLPEFVDPGMAMVDRAVVMLGDARGRRDAAGADAERVIRAAAGAAPEPPPLLARVEAAAVVPLSETAHFLAGVGEGVEDLVRFARTLNPLDPWNRSHPASYVANLSTTAAGLVTATVHPAELVKATVGTGWGSDPARAAGTLVPGLALGLVSGGGGKVAAGAGLVTRRVAERAAERAALRASIRTFERTPPKTGFPEHLAEQREIGDEYRHEVLGLSQRFPGRLVRYLDDAERELRRVTVHDGLLFGENGRPFASRRDGSGHSRGAKRSIFVMDRHGNLFASNEHAPGVFHHSSLLAGGPTSGAGEIEVVRGALRVLSDQSGHYLPTTEMMLNVLQELHRDGVDVTRVLFDQPAR